VEKQTIAGRTALILVIVGLAVLAFLTKGLRLGQDLEGGTTIRFSLDLERARAEGRVDPRESDAEVVANTLRVIEQRIDKWGLAEIAVTPLGEDKFEIALPNEIDTTEIVGLVTSLGDLQFRIEVLPRYQPDPETGEMPERTDVWQGTKKPDGTVLHAADDAGFEAFKDDELAKWREAHERALRYEPTDPRYRLVRVAGSEGSEPEDFKVVEVPADEAERFGGSILSSPAVGQDPQSGPVVLFSVKADYQNAFGRWTGRNVGLPMAILLNDEYDTAPRINEALTSNVQVTLGSGSFEEKETQARQLVTVLQTGSIRVKPIQEGVTTIGPTLAGEAVRRGILSTVVAFALVLAFMVGFYLWAGVVADLALVLNLVLLVGAMAFFDATLTLPGVAGIVLTLGMAVDANILVFERIREEQKAGRTVARAVAEGYQRAFTTIVDSNVTTFITAAFLYAFGSGAIKGFAVSLTLGLLASMFTAIYVTRTVFEARIRRGNTSPIRMAGAARVPSISWMALRSKLIPVSLVVVAASLVAFFSSPDDVVYDIDFTGGMKLQARFAGPSDVDSVRRALAQGPRTVEVRRERAAEDDASAEAPTKTATAGPYDAQVVRVGDGNDWFEVKVSSAQGSDPSLTERERLDALRAFVRQAFEGRLVSPWLREGPRTWRSPEGDAARADWDGRLFFRLAVEDPQDALTAEALEGALTEAMPHWVHVGGRREQYPASRVERKIDVVATGSPSAREKLFDVWWRADKGGEPAETDAQRLRAELHEFLGGERFTEALAARVPAGKAAGARAVTLADPFPVSDLIGRGVAERQRNDALVALFLSLAGIVAYVGFRFRSYPMGFSAILCLFHDVVVALGAVTLVDHLGVVDARINLGLVAAFLTIVGFSVNDTVVTFDRIRELRGKAPRITSKMIDDAVNQTLSRTWRTSATALITVVVLFVANFGQRSVLEGLSFTLLVGMVAGVYSTIAIAGPLLLYLPWFWGRVRRWQPRAWALSWPFRARGALVLAGAVALVAVASFAVWKNDAGRTAFLALLVTPLAATLGLWAAWAVLFGVGAFVAGYVLLFPWTRRPDPDREVSEADRAAAARVAARADA
jgi:SecD/SecF fusion protein